MVEINFGTDAHCGRARSGTLRVGKRSLETPILFPIVNFYAGGTAQSLFGGGIFRSVKEFMTGHTRSGSQNYTDLFTGVMMSVSSLWDYGDTNTKVQGYLETPIRSREPFSDFGGIILADSGGFKFMTSDDGQFAQDMDQEQVYEIQRDLGADIILNLDYPILPSDSFEERQYKMRETAENAVALTNLSQGGDAGLYLTVHGHNYSMIDRFFDILESVDEDIDVAAEFDGIAMGGLVPLKGDYEALIGAVTGAKKVLSERGLGDLPFHVLGISGKSIPLLVALGADSFDSSSFIHAAANRTYYTSLTSSVHLDEADFEKCGCRVCEDPELVDRMKGNAEFHKDILGPVAMHNLIIQAEAIGRVREAIETEDRSLLAKEIEEIFESDERTRTYAYQVINKTLMEFF